jgi:hypothetical protein
MIPWVEQAENAIVLYEPVRLAGMVRVKFTPPSGSRFFEIIAFPSEVEDLSYAVRLKFTDVSIAAESTAIGRVALYAKFGRTLLSCSVESRADVFSDWAADWTGLIQVKPL